MLPSLKGLRLDLKSAKYTMPSTLSFNYSNKSLQKIMWQVAPVSRNHTSLHEVNEVLNKSSFMSVLQ